MSLQRLDDYLDDALDPAARQEVEAELARDPGLRGRVETRRAAIALVREAPRPQTPKHLAWLVMRRIKRGVGRDQAGFSTGIGLEATAGALLVIAAAAWIALTPEFLDPAPAAPARARLDGADRALIERHATVESVGIGPNGGGLLVEVTLRDPGAGPALEDALRARGGAEIVPGAGGGRALLRVSARPAPAPR